MKGRVHGMALLTLTMTLTLTLTRRLSGMASRFPYSERVEKARAVVAYIPYQKIPRFMDCRSVKGRIDGMGILGGGSGGAVAMTGRARSGDGRRRLLDPATSTTAAAAAAAR